MIKGLLNLYAPVRSRGRKRKSTGPFSRLLFEDGVEFRIGLDASVRKNLDESTTALTIKECAELFETDETILYRHSKTKKFTPSLLPG